jgi:non-lysosomal glucosylceramidase
MEKLNYLPWPVLSRYDQEHTSRIALPIGGIGTGTVSLGGRGNLQDWEIVNRPAKGFTPDQTFFCIRTAIESAQPIVRALEGILPPELYEGWSGSPAANAGLPRFRQYSFESAYPFGAVLLGDPDVPVDVRIEAFNPLIPGDADLSGIPVAVLRFVLINKTASTIAASVCGSIQNFIGTDGSLGASQSNANSFRNEEGIQGIFLRSHGVPSDAEQWGTLALSTTAAGHVTFRTKWAKLSWGNALLDFWDDFSNDGRLEERESMPVDSPTASLSVPITIPPNEIRSITFLLSWHFPNRLSWRAPDRNPQAWDKELRRIGNYYATKYQDAWQVATQVAKNLDDLEQQTVRFVSSLCESDLPQEVKEAALFNLSTLRTQTCFRTPDGHLFGWEGCQDRIGSCFGSCTHVWNYEQAVAFLFGDLAKGMREVEFAHATDARGLMSFRVNLPLEYGTRFGVAAADGQMGCLIKIYREWQLSGDEVFLRKLWPQVRKALEFCWIPGGWDADQDGVMEGCQHNTMDVEYYGPNPQMGFLYLCALRCADEMATHLGEKDFAETCHRLFRNGSGWLDENLFDGEYYEHRVITPKEGFVADGLTWDMGAKDRSDPDLQLAGGCLVDQLFGQFLAHVCGLGYLASQTNIRKALESVLRYNRKSDFYGHFNHMRSYVLNDESALVMASYPRGNRPLRPFPYYNEVMTGFEYVAAIGLLYENEQEAGLRCIKAIRDRYDGRRRNPFNEAECGHHYARAMASWAAILALSGFHYSAVTGTMTFIATREKSRMFWSTGYAWGTVAQTPRETDTLAELTVFGGRLKIRRLVFTGTGSTEELDLREIKAGETRQIVVRGSVGSQ